MSFFGFNKRFKHRSFDYIPRYYDPEKEALEERLDLYRDGGDPLDKAKKRIRSGLKSKYRADSSMKRQAVRASNIRLAVIIIVLIAISIAFLQSSTILRLVQTFSNG